MHSQLNENELLQKDSIDISKMSLTHESRKFLLNHCPGKDTFSKCDFCKNLLKIHEHETLERAIGAYRNADFRSYTEYQVNDFTYLYHANSMSYNRQVIGDMRSNSPSFNPLSTRNVSHMKVQNEIESRRKADPTWEMTIDEFSEYVDRCILNMKAPSELLGHLKSYAHEKDNCEIVNFVFGDTRICFTSTFYGNGDDVNSGKYTINKVSSVVSILSKISVRKIGYWFKVFIPYVSLLDADRKFLLVLPVGKILFDILVSAKHISIFLNVNVIKILNLFIAKEEERTCNISKMFDKETPEKLNDLFQIKGLERSIFGLKEQIENLNRALNKLATSQNNIPKRQAIVQQISDCKDIIKKKELIVATLEQKNRIIKFKNLDIAHPSMDSQNEVEVTYEQAQNTALGVTEGETETIVVEKPLDLNYVDEILTDKIFKFPSLTDRFLFFKRITLSRSISRGSVLAVFNLPADFVLNNWSDTNMLPFRTFTFYSGSLEFKIQANIPKTNQVNIRFGTVYHWLQRDRRAELANVHTVSQMPCGRINGHKGSSDTIKIPYASYVPTIPIIENTHMLNLYYVTVIVVAMTNYEAPPGAVDETFLNCYIKFCDDTRFYGQKEITESPPPFIIPQQPLVGEIIDEVDDLEISHPSMFKAAVAAELTKTATGITRSLVSTANSIVGSTLKSITARTSRVVEDKLSQALPNKKSNRDKATDSSNKALHQRTVTNMAGGSGEFSGEVFRLNSSATTPHPDFVMGVEKFSSIQDIIEIQGFINSFPVNLRDDIGTEICSLRVQPGVYSQVVGTAPRNLFPSGIKNWAPIDHLAGWFLNFQGRVHYRFEVVADGFKTCRLRIAYHPYNKDFTFSDSQSCYYETYDLDPSLDAQLEFDFVSPYIVSQNNMNVRDVSGFARPVGYIKVFVEIPINQPADLIDHFDLLVFKAAQPNEVIFSVPRNNTSLFQVTNEDLPDIPDTDPPPSAVWLSAFLQCNIFNPRTVAGVATWDVSFVFQSPGGTVTFGPLVTNSATGFGLSFSPTSIVRYRDNQNFIGNNLVFRSGAGGIVENRWGFIVLNDEPVFVSQTRTYVPPFPLAPQPVISTWFLEYRADTDPLVPVFTFSPGFPPFPVPALIENLQVAYPSMDTRHLENEHPELTNKITLLDSALHGESHMDLYENLRRFEKWHSLQLQLDLSKSFTKVASIPLSFGGPVLRNFSNTINRANKITHLHDAMRFTRGSLRFLLNIVSTDSSVSNKGTFRIRHIPQVLKYPFTVEQQTSSSDYTETGYADTYISLSQNNVIPLEFPNYLPTNSVLNASYLSGEFLTNVSQGLGVLEIFYIGPEQDVTITIDRALADDNQFFMFNGFPVRNSTYQFSAIEFPGSPVLPTRRDELAVAHPSMFKSVYKAANSVNDINSKITDLTDFLKSESFVDSAGSYVITLSTQIAHIIANPKPATFAFSVIQVLNTFKVITITRLMDFENCLINVWKNFFSEEIRPSGFNDDVDTMADLSATLFSGVSAFFQVKGLNFADKISSGAFHAGNMYTRVVSFFKSVFNFIIKSVKFICKKFFPKCQLLKYIEDDKVEKWVNRVNIITDPTVFHKISKNRKAISIIYALCKQGEYYQLLILRSKTMTKMAQVVARTLIDIKRLRDKIGVEAQVPNVKFDPYCFYIASDASQIGKSDMLKEISMEIVDFNNISLSNRANAFFEVPESDKWWTLYSAQKIIIFDDFGRLVKQDPCEEDGARLAGLKGASPWEVPSPFERKGTVSVAEIIACASNYLYPTVNGLKSSVLHSRRNIVFEVKADFSKYKHCGQCSIFSFGCPLCKIEVGLEKLSKREHLSFQQKHPSENKNIGEKFTYLEAVNLIKQHSKAYFEIERAKYNTSLKRMKLFTSDPLLSVFNVPPGCEDEYDELIQDADFEDVISGSIDEMEIANSIPSGGVLGKDSFEEDSEYGDVDLDTGCSHWDYDFDAEKSVTKVVYDKDDEVAVIIFADNKELKLTPCGEKHCLLDSVFENFCIGLKKKFGDFQGLPRRFQDLTFEKSRYLKDLADGNSDKISLVLRILGGIVIACSAVALVKWISSPSDSEELPDLTGQYVVTRQVAHPALSYSGDVLTKFVQKFKSKVAFKKKNMTAISLPSSNTIEICTEIVDRCRKSTILLSYTSTKEGRRYVVRAVSVCDKIFVTQLHSLMTVLIRIKKDMAYYEKNRIFCTEECKKSWPCSSSLKCTEKMYENIQLEVSKVCKSGKELEVKVRIDEFMKMNSQLVIDNEGSDIVFFKFNAQNCTTQNIFNDLCSVKKYEYSIGNRFMILNIGTDPQLIEAKDVKEINQSIKYEANAIKEWYEDGNLAVLVCGFVCNNPNPKVFRNGCGSLLIDCSTGTVVGVMSSSSDKILYFNAITREQILECFRMANGQTWNSFGDVVSLIEKKSNLIDIPQDDDTKLLKTVPSMNVYHAVKTTIRPSLCHGEFGSVIRQPCHLSQNGDKGQTAMINGLSNYKPHLKFDQEHIRMAIKHVSNMYKIHCEPILNVVSCRNLKQAVCGIDGHIERICMSTSPGFPWCCSSKFKRKSDLLDFDEQHELVGIDRNLLMMINDDEKMMKEGRVPTTIFQISLKDERLPNEKLDNVRLIQGSPLNLTISSRKYLMDFNYAFQINRLKLEHAVGMNQFSIEWHHLASELTTFSPYICVGDFSKFGPRLLSDFVRGAYEVMNDWYDQYNCDSEDRLVRQMIGERHIDSYNFCFDQCVKLSCGSPSGAINTVIVNTICNQFYLRCAWLGIFRDDKALSSLNSFDKCVKVFFYGDDLIFAVKPEIKERFNNQTLHDFFRNFGVKYTDVTKGESMRKYCTIEEATFLKTGFTYNQLTGIQPGVWMPLPNFDDLMDTLNWVRKPKGCKGNYNIDEILKEAILQNCDGVIRKLWFHGRNTFEENQSKIINFFATKNIKLLKLYDFNNLQLEYGYPLSASNIIKWR